MPISNEEFDDTRDEVSTTVLNFLKNNRDRGAYNLSEIAQGIGFKGATGESPVTLSELFKSKRQAGTPGTGGIRPAYSRSLKEILSDIVSQGLAEMKTVSGKDYYRVK